MNKLHIRAVRAVALACLAQGFVAACDGSRAAEVVEAPAPITLSADSASNPTVAYDERAGTAYLAWVGKQDGKNAVFVAVVNSTGAAGEPVRANDLPGDAAPHLQAPAQVAVGPEGTVYVLWQNNTPVEGRRFPASDLRLAVSADGGRSFRPAITVNDDVGGPPTSHTFHDLAVAEDGTVYVSWIDSRESDAVAHQRMPAMTHPESAGESRHAQHSHALPPGGPQAMTGGTVSASHDHGPPDAPVGPEIRLARSTDGGRTFGASVVVDSAACPCCRTSLALGNDGTVYIAWRKIFPGNVRDIVVARAGPSLDEISQPVRVHRDEWVFPGCPHAGPSVSVDAAGRVVAGWYTGREGRQGLWYAVSEDGGASFGPPSAVLTEDWVPPSQLRLSVADGRVWAVWDDRTGGEPRIRAATGLVGGDLHPLPGWEVAGSDPAVAATAEGAWVSWLNGDAAMAGALTPGASGARPSPARGRG